MFLRFTLLLLSTIVLLSSSCKQSLPAEYPPSLVAEVQMLTTSEQKIAYLEQLYLSDQKDREGNTSHEQLVLNDKLRLQKMSAYLDTYGYPSRKELSKSAATAPYIILHHAPDNTARHKYFPMLYKAVKDNNLPKETFAFFLGRFQKMENGSWIDFDRPFTVDEEIDTLIRALHLEETVAKLNQ